MNLSHVRILAVVSVSFLAIWGFVRARTALERNIHMLNSGVASFTMIDPVRPIGSTQDHVFTYLLQSHIFALLGETQIAADKCTSALQTAKLDKELKKTISALCDARRSIVMKIGRKQYPP